MLRNVNECIACERSDRSVLDVRGTETERSPLA
jgi:hypothetical protein